MAKVLNYSKLGLLQTLISLPENENKSKEELSKDVDFWYNKLCDEAPEKVTEDTTSKKQLLNEFDESWNKFTHNFWDKVTNGGK